MEPIIRYRSITYLVFGLVMTWLGAKTTAMVFGLIGPRFDRVLLGDIYLSGLVGFLLAIGLTYVVWTNERANTWVTEVIVELMKVTWPEVPETRRSTWIVVAVAAAISLVLAAFDFFWKFATDLIL